MLQLKQYSLFGFLVFSQIAGAQPLAPSTLTVDQFLQLAFQETEDFQSVDKSLKSLEYEIEARDLQLATNLQLDVFDTRDREDVFNNINRNSHLQLYGVTLSKPFSTGTRVSLGADYEIAETTATGNLYRADWEVALAQDLWRNGFGRSVRLRRQSDQMEWENRKLNLILQRQQLMNTLENLYWDYALVQKERVIRQENLKRSEQILSWTNRRMKVSAARDTDLLQVQALLSSRKLELADIERLEVSTKNQMNQLVPSLASQAWVPALTELEKDRAIQSLVYGGPKIGTPVLLATTAAQYRSRQLQVQTEAVKDNLNPVLQLQLAHSQNGIRSDSPEAVDRALGNNKTDANRVGLIFSMNLDMGLMGKSRDSARLAAESAALTAQRLTRTSELNWIDLQAEMTHLKSSLQLSQDLFNYQKKNIESERRYFQQGRNTIFEFINFEIVTADAELRFFRALTQIRKAEGNARLYSVVQEASLE